MEAVLQYSFMTAIICTSVILLITSLTVINQVLFKNTNNPPVVFHWFPVIGSAISYGINPYSFFAKCQKKHGEIFTFVLFGRKTTVFLGTKGTDFILNAKYKDVSAEEIYSVLTTPVFGRGVIYDCSNAKLMEQKRCFKSGLGTDSLRLYVPLIESEITDYINRTPAFQGATGVVNVPPTMAEITIFTACRSLQGAEVRKKLDSTFAHLFHDLDNSFTPINFLLPWAPLPRNRKRDIAQKKAAQMYIDIIHARRAQGRDPPNDSTDMLWNLMNSTYKDGSPIPDEEIAHLMIGLLMAGQHASSVISSWILLHLAAEPAMMEDLYREQISVFGRCPQPLTLESIQKLRLHTNVVRETLRLHPPMHSLMRKVKNPLHVPNTGLLIPDDHVLLASPGYAGLDANNYANSEQWLPHRWDVIVDSEDPNIQKVDYGFGAVPTGASSAYLPFGSGRHRCIGEQFALTQLSILTAVMVREFVFRNPQGKFGVGPTDYSSLFVSPKWPANILWERRSRAKRDS